ncbi:phage holin [Enterococcus lactis]|uniref:phage holin n=1 Tax=Enterococcus lactis TaxID=357441 RepID=UPI0012E16946|nr:phage holin [Enterococcus lactis]EGP4828588.1 phage holin [Enterococcus faecium]EGP5038282.1 phage holin [Enterococcus faecium]EGP5737588.1 phage holin [Enterococcus faecium]EME8253702.1 phage holin [Enterococcus faecium]EMF0311272.1 phage holin [Enterococcus faecium]
MKNINWKVRMKNKSFWLAIVSAGLLLSQVIAVPFGYKFEIDVINKQLLDIVNAAFAFLSILGVVTDPTTKGVYDSEQALNYSKPKEDNKNE